MSKPVKTLALPVLTAMVAGSMLASGVFTLPRSFAQATGPLGVLIVWLIAGTGTYALARVFQTLAQRRPDLDAGIFAYAKAGFGAYAGFLSALGYWAGGCLLNVTYFVLIKATLGAVIPAFGDGSTPQAVIGASVLLWSIHALILSGVKKATLVNAVVTIVKVGTIAAAIAILVMGFSFETFSAGFWGGGAYGWSEIPGQVQSALIIAVYVFLGIEGASVYSRFARNRKDVGRATLLGLAGVAVLFFLVTLLPYGILPREELASLRNPSLGGVLQAVVGPWGGVLVGVSVVIALSGAFLSRSLLAAEVLWSAAQAETVPARFQRENARGMPAPALWVSSSLVQLFLLLTLFADEAYTIAFKLTSAMIMVPYTLVAAYAVMLAFGHNGTGRERLRASIAAIYGSVLLWAAGPELLLGSTLIYAPATLLFALGRWERGLPVFKPWEAVLFGLLVVASLISLAALFTGQIQL